MSLEVWLAFVAASVALLLIPGPTVLLVLSYALSQGKKVAVATAAGVALGDLVAMTASLVGLGALVLASAQLFVAIKWVGAAYLIYMGYKLIKNAKQTQGNSLVVGKPISSKTAFTNAAIVTALNPKGIIFFIAFVPQFINTEAALLPQFSILIATFVGMAAANAFIYALLANKMRNQISKPIVLTWLARCGGAALMAMGIGTALFKRT